MYIALQRTKRPITLSTNLMAAFDDYSPGESLSIANPNEVWMLEIISKGPENNEAVWGARKLMDGYICALANQALIRQFPLNDKKNCLSATVMISFALIKGYYKEAD